MYVCIIHVSDRYRSFASWKTGRTDGRTRAPGGPGWNPAKTACDSGGAFDFDFGFGFAGAPPRARHCATRVDEGFRAREEFYYIAFEFVREPAEPAEPVDENEPVDESFVARIIHCGATAEEGDSAGGGYIGES